ncbi:MAG: hypothetical protein KGL63_02155 [Betaproteobacteria bacterium]|nr:hypothetical protein [Betaproteobacteria bacterium]
MKSVVQAIPIPSGALINRHLPGAHFQDCYAVPIEPDSPSALAIFLVVAARTPGWVNRLIIRCMISRTVPIVAFRHKARQRTPLREVCDEQPTRRGL